MSNKDKHISDFDQTLLFLQGCCFTEFGTPFSTQAGLG